MGLSGQEECNHKSSYKRKAESESEKDMVTEAEIKQSEIIEDTMWLSLTMEKGPKGKKYGQPLKTGKDKERDSPRASRQKQ